MCSVPVLIQIVNRLHISMKGKYGDCVIFGMIVDLKNEQKS